MSDETRPYGNWRCGPESVPIEPIRAWVESHGGRLPTFPIPPLETALRLFVEDGTAALWLCGVDLNVARDEIAGALERTPAGRLVLITVEGYGCKAAKYNTTFGATTDGTGDAALEARFHLGSVVACCGTLLTGPAGSRGQTSRPG